MDEKNKITVKIFNSLYTLKTNADELYMNRIVNYINNRIESICEKDPNLPSFKITILALIEIVDELLKIKEEINLIEKELGNKTTNLINIIEEKLAKDSYRYSAE